MEQSFTDLVKQLHGENDWRKIIKLDIESNVNEARNLLWAWPSEENLKFIEQNVKEYGLNGIISIGCGSGLLEWLLQQATGLPVVGYELDESWWASRYSNKFIELQFPKQPPKPDIYIKKSIALLFCYFNNRKAFIDYVYNYSGNLIFIIGPGIGVDRHTNPEPFRPCFENKKWELMDFQEIKETKDFIAVYVRK